MNLRLNQLAVALLCAAGFVVSSFAEVEEFGGIRWYYSVENGEATITSQGRQFSGDIVFPETLGGYPVVALERGAIYDGQSATSITFPDCFRTIEEGNFRYTRSLTNMTFGTGLRDFAPFQNHDAFQFFTVPEGNPYFSAEGPVLYTKDKKTLVMCGANVTSFEVPSHVTAIGPSAFSEMESLESVTFHPGLLEIGDFAFNMCQNLEGVTLPANLQVLGNGAFSSCSNLGAISIPGTVAKIGGSAFSGCNALASLTIANGVKDIGTYAFDNCEALAAVVVPNSVTNIGGFAFLYCTSLSDVTIGSGVMTIGSGLGEPSVDEWGNTYRDDAMPAFGGCENLLDFKLADGNGVFEEIGGCLFLRATPKSAKTLAVYPNGRSDLYFTGDVNVTKIGEAACAYCPNFTTLDITNSVRDIGTQSFMDCWSLGKVVVNPGVTNIDYGAFGMNMELADVEIAGTVRKIGKWAFMHCYMPGDPVIGRLVLHEGIEEIGEGVIERARDLHELVVPDSVTMIGEGAFSEAENLTRLTLGSGVTELPDRLCSNDQALKSVKIRGKVTTIGALAFDSCVRLESINLPDSLESIEHEAFRGCEKLPYASISAATIKEAAFMDCSSLARVDLADSVRTIAINAFGNCNALRNVVIPAGIETIAPRAFWSCGIAKAYLPKKLEGVVETDASSYDSIFYRCPLAAENVIYYGNEGPAQVTVTFMSQGEVVETRKYLANTLDYLPPITADCLAFVGWYTAEEGGRLLADEDVTADLTAYARWVESPFADTGVQEWSPAEDEAFPGEIVWRTADLTAGDSALASIAVVGPAVVSFQWKHSGSMYDSLAAYVDDEEVDFTESEDWEKASIQVPDSGSHVVTWTYSRDRSSDDPPAACAWLADVRVVHGTAKTITFDANGGTLDEDRDATRKVVMVLGKLPTADKDGVAFAGWWTEREGGERVTASTKPEGDATYYAHWVELPFTVSGDGRFWLAEDGSWATLSSCDGRSVTASVRLKGPCMVSFDMRHEADYGYLSSFTVDGDRKLSLDEDTGWYSYTWSCDDTEDHVVEWEFCYRGWGWWDEGCRMRLRNISMGTPYEIGFDPGDNANVWGDDMDRVEAGIGYAMRAGTMGYLPVPRSDLYLAFDGWYTAAEGGEKVTSETPVTGPATYYAHWVESPVMTYWLRSWVYEPDGSLVSDNDCNQYNPSVAEKDVDGPGTLTFRWRMQSDSGNGKFEFLVDNPEGPDLIVTNTLTKSSEDWVTERYVFTDEYTSVRWAYGIEGRRTGAVERGWIKDVKWTPGVVDPVEWKVTFDANGGELRGEAVKTVVDEFPIGKMPDVKNQGYGFAGWFTERDGGVQVEPTTIVTSDVACYAHWVELPVPAAGCTVTFDANGGRFDDSSTTKAVEVTAERPLEAMPKPTRRGSLFGGWAMVRNGSRLWNGNESLTVDGVETMTVYAIWVVPGTYVIAFDPGVKDAQWSMGYQYVGASKVAKLNPCTLAAPRGKKFAGWRRADNGRRYDDGVMVFTLADQGAVVVMEAIWDDATE